MSKVCTIGDVMTGTCSVHGAVTGTWTTTYVPSTYILTDSGRQVILSDPTYRGLCSCGHYFTPTSGTGSAVLTSGGVKVHMIGDALTLSGGGTGTSISGGLVPTTVTSA
jgi:hypothetical protein